MAEEKKGVETNTKALQFQEFLMENEIDVFSTESTDDARQTVIFRSRIEACGQILPMAIFIDTSIFTIIRTQIIAALPADRQPRIKAYLNELNLRFKIFKYYMRDDGTVFLEVCLPFVDETFDSKMVQLILSVIVQHLEDTYEEIMGHVWGGEGERAD
ncbi:MAG: hypothetical protein ACFN0X_08110 [Mitsuokella sp.]|mgnify:CR=1 FL=1